MSDPVDVSEVALQALRVRITKVLPAQIRACLEELDDDQIWWRPNEQSNSIGNLVLHVRGSVTHFLCRGVGKLPYERDRPAEFATTVLSRDELLKQFDEMVRQTEETFAKLDSTHLIEPSTDPAYYSTIYEDLFGVAIHMAVHTGQIVYVTKLLREGAVNDLWAQTHSSLGAWKT